MNACTPSNGLCRHCWQCISRVLCTWLKTFPGAPRFPRINYPRDLTGASDRLSGKKYMYLYVCLLEFPVCSRLFIGLIRPTYIPEHWYLPVQHVTHLSYMQSTCSFVHTTCTFSDLENFQNTHFEKSAHIVYPRSNGRSRSLHYCISEKASSFIRGIPDI